MKKEYDFSKAEQGKFYRPTTDLEIPIYLNKEVKTYFIKKAADKNLDLEKEMNLLQIIG